MPTIATRRARLVLMFDIDSDSDSDKQFLAMAPCAVIGPDRTLIRPKPFPVPSPGRFRDITMSPESPDPPPDTPGTCCHRFVTLPVRVDFEPLIFVPPNMEDTSSPTRLAIGCL